MATEAAAHEVNLSRADIAILAEDLSYADAAAPGLGKELLHYVLTGEEGPLTAGLDDLDHHVLFQTLAPPNYEFNEQTPQEKRRIASRMRLHEMQVFDPVAMRRFGWVVANGRYAGLGRSSLCGTETTPVWLPALLDMEEAYKWPGNRRLLTGERCRDMCVAAGYSITPIVECLFTDNSGKYGQTSEWTFGLPGLAEILAGDPAVVLEAARAFDAEAQRVFIAYLGTSGLLRVPDFLDAAFGWVALKKGIAEVTLTALSEAPEEMVRERIEMHLGSKVAAERLIGVRVAAKCLADPGPRLDAHAKSETSKSVLQAIEEVRALLAPTAAAPGDDARSDGADGYCAADGSYVEAPPLVVTEAPGLSPDARKALAHLINEVNAAAFAEHEIQRKQPWPEPEELAPDRADDKFWIELHERGEKARRERIAVLRAPYEPPVAADAVGKVLDVMTGVASPKDGRRCYNTYYGFVGGSQLKKAQALDRKLFKAFLARADIDWRHLTRIMLITYGAKDYAFSNFFFAVAAGDRGFYDIVEGALDARIRQGADVRTIFDMLAEHGIAEDALVEKILKTGSQLHCAAAPETATLWPVLFRHVDQLDRAIATATGPSTDYRDKSALTLLGAFSKLPRRYLKPVLDAALGGDKLVRAFARRIAGRAGDLVALLAPMIDAGEATKRRTAIGWIGDLLDPTAVPILRKALKAKGNIVDRAAIIAALAACGDDISDLFAPDKLLDEARTGLAKTKSDFSALFDPDALSVLHWADGTKVAPDLVRWWFTMAHKLKQPAGDALLHMALDRLAAADAAHLGEMVLAAFNAYDTRQADVSEAEAYAKAELATRMKARSWDKNFTKEQALADLRAEKLGSYPQSAHEHRGLLALARHASGPIAAAQARHMLVKHWRRTPQNKAMLDYLASNPAPAALQVLIGVSQRHKTAAVQSYATAIADRLAEERGWTRDELEDRTVPTADLDAEGGVDLPIGGAIYRAELDESAALSLRNPDGKTIAALPAPKGEGAEEAKAAKASVAKLRKEIKQTVEAQRRRLHEAMCAGRLWPAGDFQTFILAHPIVGRLARRLLFTGFDAKGTAKATFRVLADGTLTDAADGAVTWKGIVSVGIAHLAQIGAAEADRWVTHLADYEVAPLFEQVTRSYKTIADAEATEIDDRRGHTLDTFALRGAATKLDYVRSSIEDGGTFYGYEKRFERAGIAAVVGFTGSYVPEQQKPCALEALTFVRLKEGQGAWGASAVELGEVPPVLLSEAWNDYIAMAAAGTGFDPDWEKKTG